MVPECCARWHSGTVDGSASAMGVKTCTIHARGPVPCVPVSPLTDRAQFLTCSTMRLPSDGESTRLWLPNQIG